MRPDASVLHCDLDAFYASVEQRDKPSLRGKPVIVGGIGQRGVVATASYQARVFGVHSAMPTHEARRLCPHGAYLVGRFGAYRQASAIVMGLLRELSPLVEPLSLDEAFVDLAAGGHDTSPEALLRLAADLRIKISELTGGLTGSVGLGSSKFMAKVASELAKPDGIHLVTPGTEVDVIAPMPVRAIPGVGPVTAERLNRLGILTIGQLQQASERELVRELGKAAGEGLMPLAFARDDRQVESVHETKSISVEDTFETDLLDLAELDSIIGRDAAVVAARVAKAGLFARTVTIKVRVADFTTYTRSRTLVGATDDADVIAAVARSLLRAVDTRAGVRLLGVGAAHFTPAAQEALFDLEDAADARASLDEAHTQLADPGVAHWRRARTWLPGLDVEHDEHGRGWVWGAGLGRVTVRFETAGTGIGPLRTLRNDDPALRLIDP